MSTSQAPPRRRRKLKVALVTLVVLLALLVAADRIGVAVAESKAASLLEQSENLDGKPDVDITGFPFLTQVVSGNYPQINVTADRITLVEGSLRVPVRDMHVALHDVTVPHDFSGADVARATATARLDLTDLSTLLRLPLKYLGNGLLGAEQTVAGQTVSLQFGVKRRGDSIAFTDAKATVAGREVPLTGLTDAVNAALGTVVDFSDLPFRVRLEAASVGPKGIDLALSGRDLSYRR